MRDHTFVDRETGARLPVAQLTTDFIRACLNDGIEVEPHDIITTIEDAERSVIQRLHLELLIRREG